MIVISQNDSYEFILEQIVIAIRMATVVRMSGDADSAYHDYAVRRVLRDIDKALDCEYISLEAVKLFNSKKEAQHA